MSEQAPPQGGLNIPIEKVVAAYQKKIGELTHLVIMYEAHIEQLTEQIHESSAPSEKKERSSS